MSDMLQNDNWVSWQEIQSIEKASELWLNMMWSINEDDCSDCLLKSHNGRNDMFLTDTKYALCLVSVHVGQSKPQPNSIHASRLDYSGPLGIH